MTRWELFKNKKRRLIYHLHLFTFHPRTNDNFCRWILNQNIQSKQLANKWQKCWKVCKNNNKIRGNNIWQTTFFSSRIKMKNYFLLLSESFRNFSQGKMNRKITNENYSIVIDLWVGGDGPCVNKKTMRKEKMWQF